MSYKLFKMIRNRKGKAVCVVSWNTTGQDTDKTVHACEECVSSGS